MSIEALKAARAAMTNVVAVYDKGIAGHLVEDAFNKVRAAIAQADAALSSAALEASATLAIAKQLADERRKTQELLVAIQPFLEFNASTKYVNLTVKSDDIARARRAFSEGSK